MVIDNINWFFQIIFTIFGISSFVEKGIPASLPKMRTEIKPLEKNTVRIFVDGKNKIFINKKEIILENLKDSIVKFIDNSDKNLSNKQCKSIVYLKGDRKTKYESYIQVLDQVKEGYKIVRARELGWTIEKITTFDDKTASEKDIKKYKEIIFLYPVVISEADPTDE